MKLLPVWQPYASLIALGAKTIETRHWPAFSTLVGNRLAIYASKNTTDLWLADEPPFNRYLHGPKFLPLGVIVATVVIHRVDEMTPELIANLHPEERAFGNYQPGRFAWHLSQIEVMPEPVPFVWRTTGPKAYLTLDTRLSQQLRDVGRPLEPPAALDTPEAAASRRRLISTRMAALGRGDQAAADAARDEFVRRHGGISGVPVDA